jgi:hypothetical protein
MGVILRLELRGEIPERYEVFRSIGEMSDSGDRL